MWVFLLFRKTKHINKGNGRKLRERSWVLRTGTPRTKERRISRWTLSWDTQASRTGRSASWYSGYSDTWMSKWDYSKQMLAYFPPSVYHHQQQQQQQSNFFKGDLVKGLCNSQHTINLMTKPRVFISTASRIPWAFPNWCFFGSLLLAVIC